MTNKQRLILDAIAILATAGVIVTAGAQGDARQKQTLSAQLQEAKSELARVKARLDERTAESGEWKSKAGEWKSKAEKAARDLAPFQNALDLFERGGAKVESGCFRIFQIYPSRTEGLAHECHSGDIVHLTGLPPNVVDDQELNVPAYRVGVYQYQDKKHTDRTVANWAVWRPAIRHTAD
jgi:hypothetical protein